MIQFLNRKLLLPERIIALTVAVVLLGLSYYFGVQRNITRQLEDYARQQEETQMQLDTVNTHVMRLLQMRAELNSLDNIRRMESYNNSKAEIALLNRILNSANEYSIVFSSVTRDGNTVRRNFSLQFTTDTYQGAQVILAHLTLSEYRCLLGNMSCSITTGNDGTRVIGVNVTATFYETMVGGTPDSGLPEG